MVEAIPHQFHFVFGLKKQRKPFHLIYYLCLESCLQVNEPDRVYFHYHYEPYGRHWDLIKERITPVRVDLQPLVSRFQYTDKGVKKYSYAHQSDFIRLDVLIEYGGIYADIDTLFVRKFPPRLFAKPFVLGREDDIECPATGRRVPSLCNALIMSRPKAEFAVLWRRRMEQCFDGTWSRHSTVLPQQLALEHPDLIHVEPSRSFYSFMWTREGLQTLLQGCERDDEGIFSIHLWQHLWGDKRRRDFSDFHAGLVTEEHIRRVDTTYNLLARRYLPEGTVGRFFPRAWSRVRRAVRRGPDTF